MWHADLYSHLYENAVPMGSWYSAALATPAMLAPSQALQRTQSPFLFHFGLTQINLIFVTQPD
jgi:hypothetical protein